MKCFFLTLCFIFCAISNLRAETYVLTVQHSGSMWTLYSLHTMTKRRICDCNFYRPEAHLDIRDWHKFYRYENGVDESKDCIYFSHSYDRFYNAKLPVDKDNDKLLIVLRNFKECFRSLKISPYELASLLRRPISNPYLKNLINNLNLYDSWSPEKRLLVYYEDLMNKPEETFKTVLSWLGEDAQVVNHYMQDFATHKADCLRLYKTNKVIKKFANAKSKGNEVFYTKNMPSEVLQNLDQLFEKRYPNLWKYFERFQS